MAFAHHGVGLPWGSTMAIMAPSSGPLKTRGLQVKSPQGPGVRALWGQQWTLCLFCGREKYCHNGGMVFAHDHVVRLLGGPR